MNPREEIERLIASGEARAAWSLIGQLWRENPGPASAGFVLSRLEKVRSELSLVRCRVAVLRSFTVEPVIPLLRAEAAIRGIDLEVQLGEFNTYAQEILDAGSSLYRFQPDIIVLAVQTRDLAPDLWSRFPELSAEDVQTAVGRVIESYRGWIKTLRARTPAHVILHNLETPARPSAGLLDGQTSAIQLINHELNRLATEHTGVCVLDYDALVARHGRLRWTDEQKWLTMRMPIAADCLRHLAAEWLRFIHPLTGRVCKVLVTDLDNTLWGGVIGEDGMAGIKIGAEYPGAAHLALQQAMLDLHHRGILLTICSKNNSTDALEVLEKHPGMLLRPKHFAAMRINWSDKAQGLREIAAELNIGTDALAFIDDNPVEREFVRAELPEVTVIDLPADPMRYADTLRDCAVFERLALTAEDRARSQYYTEQRQRAEVQSSAASLEDFYRSLEQVVELAPVSPETLARVAQLTQKTNQFNLTTRRYSEKEISDLAGTAGCRVISASVRDRFGDNGIVGVVITRQDEIDSFLMSCRVIGRGVESAILAGVIDALRGNGRREVQGSFIPTKKNAPARDFYPNHGFQKKSEQNGEILWSLDLGQANIACPEWITLNNKQVSK